MKVSECINKVINTGIVAVIRAENPEKGLMMATACIEGGIEAIEITFTVPNAEQVIFELKQIYQKGNVAIGAGTVLDAKTAKDALDAGADFVVGPNFSLDVATLCKQHQIAYLPGALTPNEIINAIENGAEIVKLFPGNAVSPSYIKAIRGPLPRAKLMPTGGVNLTNIGEWIKNGAVAVGIGSELTASAKDGNYQFITELSKEYIAAISKARGEI